jgi:phage-related protein (TIGR01555 family)
MKFLAKLWQRFFPKPQPAPTVAKALDDLDAHPWARAYRALAGGELARVEYKMPELLPGVRPVKMPPKGDGTGGTALLAMDSGYEEPLAFDNATGQPAAWGFGAGLAGGPGLAFLGFPYLAELEQITEYRTPAEALSNEMTRRWVELVNLGKDEGKKEKIKEIEARMKELKVCERFREAALKTEWFGRAHLAINIKGEDDDRTRQLPLTEIKKGTLLSFVCIEPYWMTPYSWNSTHPSRPDFYKPQSWFELGKKTHASRSCTFIFREVPDLLKPAYDFAGISIVQLMIPYVTRWLRTAKNVNDLINIFSIVTLATDLQSFLQKPEEFLKRLQVFTQTRDNRGMMVTQKDKEELSMQNVPLGSLDKLQAQAQEHMATPARMTLIDFFGITPSGLSVTAEPELKARNKYVSGMQTLGFSPNFQRVLELVQMDLYGKVDDEITFKWVALDEPTGKELGEIRKADADRDKVYLDGNVISPDEIRDKLRKDPESGYNGLEGDAPKPQEWGDVDANGEPVAAPPGEKD